MTTTLWVCIWQIGGFGAVGGLAACFHKDAVLLPQFDKTSKAWSPGAIGTIFIGAFAAWSVWCLYGPSSSVVVGTAPHAAAVSVTLRELGSSGLVGFCGGRVLTLLAQKQSDQIAAAGLSKLLKDTLEKHGK